MKNLILFLAVVLAANTLSAQAPMQFNFQGAARDEKGNVLADKNITIRLSIVGSTGSTVRQYSETRQVKTNAVGLFNIVIGSAGAGAVSGSIAGIDWSSEAKYLWIEMDVRGTGNFVNLGTTQLQSVPYAIHAKSAANAVNITGIVALANGGTGASTADQARVNLGLGSVNNTS
ncbi:MAG: hypothetical protein J7497_17085, partial [Chitinophagaceae bacterium]|nr:hypothetical protein [Chitinophagaceae bacterium]